MDIEIKQDDLNQKFLTSLAPEWLMHIIVWRNRSDLDTMSLDDLYNHLKVYEPEVQKKSESNSHNMAFISLAKNSSRNEEGNTASIPTASTQVSPAGPNVAIASISLDTTCAYIASQSNGSQIKYVDINQIDEDDIEEMNIKECRAPRSQDRGRRDNYRQGSKVEEQAPKALMAIDGVGWDWSFMGNEEENHALVADEEAPTEFALMAKTSAESEVFNNSLCSKACKKNTDSLNGKITELSEKLGNTKNMFYHYKLGLSQVEARLVEFKNQEIKFCKKIRSLELKVEFKTNRIENLINELETLKKEKEGLPEFVDDTITNYSRPSPAIESNSDEFQNRKPSVDETGASSRTILSKPVIKFVKAADRPTESKTDKVETVKKPIVQYIKLYKKTTKKTNVRGNQRNWNNLKSHQLGENFVMKNKACFNCGHFDHLSYDCDLWVKKGRSCPKNNSTHESMPPRPAIHRADRSSLRTNRPNMNAAKPEWTSFYEPAHSYDKRPFQRTSAVRSQFRGPRVSIVNRKFPTVNRKFSIVNRKFPTVNRKFPTINRKFPTGNSKLSTADLGIKGKAGNSQINIDDKGYWDSGFSRHMTGNISYLSDYEPFEGGYVSFGQGGCKITSKRNNQNRTARQHNMYSIDLNNVVPHKDLTCLVAKASADESMIWHRRLGKQHKAFCKTKLVNSVTKPLHTLHMDLFGPTSTKDETSGILRNFITEIENLKNLKNGVAERRNRTLIEAAKTMLANAKLPVTFWAEAVNTACYVQNRILVNKSQNKTPYELFNGTNSTNFSGTKEAACQDVKKDVSSLRYIALPNWFHEAHLESSTSNAQDTCNAYAPESSGISNPTATSTNPPTDHMETLAVETLILTVTSPISTACFDDSPQLSSDLRLISKRVTSQDDTPSLDNILTLTNRFEDILGVTTNSDKSNGVEADVLKNKKDERGIMIRNKARLVAQWHTQEEGIDYDEVFVHVARIKAIRLFLAYASFMGFTIYQMDVKSAFLYGTIDEEVRRMAFFSLETSMLVISLRNLDIQMSDRLILPRTRRILREKTELEKMHQVTPKECHLHAVKRIFRYLKGQPKLGLWYPKESPFDLVAYSDSDYGGATQDRKSTTIGCQFFGRRLISWQYSGFCRGLPSKVCFDYYPTVYVSHIRQFWSTARIETTNEGTKILATVDVTMGEGSGTPIEPHHTPSPEAQQTSPTTHSSPSLPPVTTKPLPTVILSDIPRLRQYTKRNRIAQSSAVPPVADELASPIGDDSQGEACPTVSGLEAEQDRANITKTSTLPSDSTPRVTSFAVDEGSMQQQLNELTDLCTRLQRQQDEMASKITAQDLEISQLKARVKLLEDREGGDIVQSGEDAPIKGRSLDEGEEAAIERSMEKGSNDTEEMVNVITSLDAATVLSSGVSVSISYVTEVSVAEVPTGSSSIPTASPPSTGVPTGDVPTGNDVVPTASPIFTTDTVATPYIRRKGKEKMVESETPKKRKLQEQMDVQMARQLEEEMERDAQRMNEQIARDAEIARIYVEEELQIMLDGLDRRNRIVAKYLEEYYQFAAELPIGERIELISNLEKYQDNYAKVLRLSTSRGEIKEKFDPVWKQIQDFIPIGSKEESERFKRKGIRLEQDSAKKLKTSEEVSEEDLKDMMQLVPVEEVYVEALQVELKRLYEPDVEDKLWTHTQAMMQAPVEWKLYDTFRVHHVISKDQEMFMRVEKDYPLWKGLAIVMISYKLQVENYSQMANDLILKINKIANSPRQQDD
nr:copia protein [Tanacetum cinerariifolium]